MQSQHDPSPVSHFRFTQETPSEDPYLTGQFGKLYTIGLQQGEDPRFLKTAVTLKHFAVYNLGACCMAFRMMSPSLSSTFCPSSEDSDGYTRHTFSANVSNYALTVPFS